MNKPSLPELFYLFLIVLVGVGAGMFSWQYLRVVQDQQSAERQLVVSQPMVLGVYAERQLPIEEPLAGGTIASPAPSINTTAMLPSEVDALFQNYCQRGAELAELDQWVAKNSADLEHSLKNNCAYN